MDRFTSLICLLPLFLPNLITSHGSVEVSKSTVPRYNSSRWVKQDYSSPQQIEEVLERIMSDISKINKNVKDLNVLHLRTTRDIVDGIMSSCTSSKEQLVYVPTAISPDTSKPYILEPSINPGSAKNPHAIRCSSYRAVNEFIPVEEVTSNDMLIEAGFDSVHGPLYFCHALADINGIVCRLYGKGNRRSCWVTTPSGREVVAREHFHLLRKPEGVNFEWRSGWPTDFSKSPVPELKTPAGVVYEWAVWDVYTCGLQPRFYFGRCDRNGAKIPGLIQAGQGNLTFTYSGRQDRCSNYEVLVCINK